MSSRNLLRSVVLATVFVCGSALAADSQPRQVRVRYSDLNLMNQDGVAALYARMRHAARSVCETGGTREIGLELAAARCRAKSLNEAIHSVGVPALTRMHVAKTGAAMTFDGEG